MNREAVRHWGRGTKRDGERLACILEEENEELCANELQFKCAKFGCQGVRHELKSKFRESLQDWCWSSAKASTTLELSNLPQGCTAETIIAQLDAGGFAERYNFVHRGVDCKRDPFAVVNCARHADACAIVRASHSVGLGSVGGQPCRAAWNPQQQGLAELAAELRRDSCGGEQHTCVVCCPSVARLVIACAARNRSPPYRYVATQLAARGVVSGDASFVMARKPSLALLVSLTALGSF